MKISQISMCAAMGLLLLLAMPLGCECLDDDDDDGSCVACPEIGSCADVKDPGWICVDGCCIFGGDDDAATDDDDSADDDDDNDTDGCDVGEVCTYFDSCELADYGECMEGFDVAMVACSDPEGFVGCYCLCIAAVDCQGVVDCITQSHCENFCAK